MKFFVPSSVIAVFLSCVGVAFGQDTKASNLRGNLPGEENDVMMDISMEVIAEGNHDHRELTTKTIHLRQVAGWASDIGAGQYGVVVTGGYHIWKLNSNRNSWRWIAGGANTVAVGNTIQVVNRWNNYWEYEHGRWTYIPIHALDVGTYGDVTCVVRSDQNVLCSDNAHVYLSNNPAAQFRQLAGGSAVRVDVCPDGNPVTVNAHNNAYYHKNDKWIHLPGGKFTDISCGGDGSIWAIGANQSINKWNGHYWDGYTGYGARISVDHTGIVWVVNSAGKIFEYKPEPCVLHHNNDHRCPAHPPTGFGSCHAPGVRCEYGQDQCCGKCFTQRTYTCDYGQWNGYFNDSCYSASQCSPDV